jgi:hypothetical protein
MFIIETYFSNHYKLLFKNNIYIYIKKETCFHQNKTKNILTRKESFGLSYTFFLLTSNDLNFNEYLC